MARDCGRRRRSRKARGSPRDKEPSTGARVAPAPRREGRRRRRGLVVEDVEILRRELEAVLRIASVLSSLPARFAAFAMVFAGLTGLSSRGFACAGAKTQNASLARRNGTCTRQRAHAVTPSNATRPFRTKPGPWRSRRPSNDTGESDTSSDAQGSRPGSRTDEKDQRARRKPLRGSSPWETLILREEEPWNITWKRCA